MTWPHDSFLYFLSKCYYSFIKSNPSGGGSLRRRRRSSVYKKGRRRRFEFGETCAALKELRWGPTVCHFHLQCASLKPWEETNLLKRRETVSILIRYNNNKNNQAPNFGSSSWRSSEALGRWTRALLLPLLLQTGRLNQHLALKGRSGVTLHCTALRYVSPWRAR